MTVNITKCRNDNIRENVIKTGINVYDNNKTIAYATKHFLNYLIIYDKIIKYNKIH